MIKKTDAEFVIRLIALREGLTVEEVRERMRLAMLSGLRSQDYTVQARWNRIPRKGDVPTPEELIAYLAENPNDEPDLLN